MRALTRRRSRGQGLAEVAVVCSIMTSMAGGGAGAAWQVLGTAHRIEATAYLRQIHSAITDYADDNDGKLPGADMYPDIRKDPNAVRNSPRSIVNIMGKRVPANLWVASRAPEQFQKAGLTYIWNTALNGKLVDQVDRTWMLMDMNAAGYLLPDQFPRPSGGYLVLYTDGSVKFEMQPPLPLQGVDAEKMQQAVANPGAAGGGGGEEVKLVAPEDPEAKEREKEDSARKSNPDEDDAVDE